MTQEPRYYRHTIIIYTESAGHNPDLDSAGHSDIVYLAQEATDGGAICDGHMTESVPVNELPEGVASFFNCGSDSDDGYAELRQGVE